MGFPIRTNIFEAGSKGQRYFARFPIQVAILFSPSDVIFTEYLKAEFAKLDRSTGEALAFFAVLDPPQEWLQERTNSHWWREYQESVGMSSFTIDNRVLMREIGRLFGIPWHSLPAIVVSTNLWQVEHISCPTSLEHLAVQLNELAKLPDKYGVPNIGHIIATLEAICGEQVDYHPPSESVRQRLRTFYTFLNTVNPYGDLESTDYRSALGRELDAVESSLNSLRRNYRSHEEFEVIDLESIDAVIEDAAGRLVAPASVAAKVLRNLQTSVDLPNLLDDESAVMIETSVTVGSFLEELAETSLGGLGPLGRRPRGGYEQINRATQRPSRRTNPLLDIDFTPGAQGVWKAFELETNLSLVQAARAAREVTMPTYFALYDPALPLEKGIVETGYRGGRRVTVDINQEDWTERTSGRHRFISLGDALYLTKAMINSPGENLDSVIQQAIGTSLPPRILNAWEVVIRIRNRGSHIHRLERRDYEKVLQNALATDVLEPLLKIKEALLQGTEPVVRSPECQ